MQVVISVLDFFRDIFLKPFAAPGYKHLNRED